MIETNAVRARAPLRLGFAGGGTDLSPFCDSHGGCILNAAVALYAYAHIARHPENGLRFSANEIGEIWEGPLIDKVPHDREAMLHRGVYNRVVAEFNGNQPLPLSVQTTVDVPSGSGMGGSSTLVIALLAAFRLYLGLPLGDYDLARIAVEIEREELGLAGGRQDQYAAAFGGFNFMEFGAANRVVVNPLRMNPTTVRELEASILLYYTGQSRQSADIIQQQQSAMASPSQSKSIESLFALKAEALEMKEAMLIGDMNAVAETMNRGWHAKKATATGVTNAEIERIIDIAFHHGAKAAKVSGAGGGGFVVLLVEPEARNRLASRLNQEPGQVLTCVFSPTGAESWYARL
jgi:D-glycero-alpha-D-manno-heptose-7-phosphate kinase